MATVFTVLWVGLGGGLGIYEATNPTAFKRPREEGLQRECPIWIENGRCTIKQTHFVDVERARQIEAQVFARAPVRLAAAFRAKSTMILHGRAIILGGRAQWNLKF